MYDQIKPYDLVGAAFRRPPGRTMRFVGAGAETAPLQGWFVSPTNSNLPRTLSSNTCPDLFLSWLDNRALSRYNNNEERTTHAVAPQVLTILLVAFRLRKQPSLCRVAVAFFAFLFLHDDRDWKVANPEGLQVWSKARPRHHESKIRDASPTSPIWNVIRMVPTSFRRCRSNRLRVCVRSSTLSGFFIIQEVLLSVNP